MYINPRAGNNRRHGGIKGMKTYQNPAKEKKTKKNFFMRNIYGIIFGVTLLVIAGVITLTLVLTTRKVPVDNKPGGDVDVDVPPTPTYSLPLEDYTMGSGASLDALVYSATLNQWRTHNGVDLLTGAGSSVMSIADGKVESVKQTTLEGVVVTIAHENGLVSIYKGLSGATVAEGDSVSKGGAIGKVAENMMIEQREGAHLHLEMKENGKYVDPAKYLTEFDENK